MGEAPENGAEETEQGSKRSGGGRLDRSAARLAGVQALYQMELTGRGAAAVIDEFIRFRFGAEGDGGVASEADEAFFADLVDGAVAGQAQIDRLIADNLAANWRLSRIDSSLRAILRAGVYELIARPDVPVRVAIDEYVDLAHAFFSADEPGFVNAVLDAVARTARPGEAAAGRSNVGDA